MRTYLLTFILLALCGSSFAAPKPTQAKLPNIWTLDVTYENPQQICVRVGPDAKPTRFWYMILTITNHTGHDAPFYPNIQLVTDTFQIVQASTNARQAVFDRIKEIYKGRYPFLEPFESVENRILQGSDNTRDLAVIFPDFDPEAQHVNIFIGGLSNETAVTYNPAVKDKNGNPEKVILSKTLELQYDISGDPAFRDSQKLVFAGYRWVMR
jgi:hypothetical protein